MSDTIFALASAPGAAGVAVMRISGPRAQSCLQTLTGRLPVPRHATLADIGHIDRGLVLWFPGPASYTGEDMAELQVHGGRAVLVALSEALAQCGARPAEPGEFTRRAVTHGKLDLTEAEAVADMVQAQTEAQRRQALRQLGGALRQLYDGWRAHLTRAEAHLAAAIDFADDDLPGGLLDDVRAQLETLRQDVAGHLADGHRGERLRSGVQAVITGAPNTGKSSLLNRLAQREVAIVTPVAGTTRDVLEVQLDIAGYPLTLADTAGLRVAGDIVEQEGVRRALDRAAQADFRLLVFDATAPLPPDVDTLARYQPGDILIINKADIGDAAALRNVLGNDTVLLSALTGDGFDDLHTQIVQRLDTLAGVAEAPTLTRVRHRQALTETEAALRRALSAPAVDQLADDVRLASRALGRITGQVGIEDLLDVIFRDFCLGK